MKPAIVAMAALLTVCSCVITTTTPARMAVTKEPVSVKSPAKAHLLDGSVVAYDSGFRMSGDTLYGRGVRYDLLRQGSKGVEVVPLDSVAAIERYDVHSNAGATVALAGIPVSAALSLALTGSLTPLFKALFGSCPTVYTWDGNAYSLEAEAFSFNVTRLLSGRDLDRLDLGRPVDGEYRLMVTNEALETHYIDHLALVTADHVLGYKAFPTDAGRVVLFGRETRLARAENQAGRDVCALIVSRDTAWYRTDSARVRQLADSAVHDWIDIAVPVPKGARRLCLALRGRNTLMSTVMFYDVLLKSQGVSSLDWQGMSRRSLPYAVNLSRWHHRHFGLRIRTRSGSGYRDLAWIRDAGPIAWHDVAVELPVPRGDTCHLRLDFLPDNWMIDWIGVSFDNPEPAQVREIPCGAVRVADGTVSGAEAVLLARNDGHYLVTAPGDCRYLVFRPEPVSGGLEREYFVRSGGYYIEWLRPDWLESGPAAWFQPRDEALTELATLWLQKRPDLERRFFEMRVPVRRSQ
jgi:hypothetical protein